MRRCPASVISRRVSVRYGAQLRLPQYTGRATVLGEVLAQGVQQGPVLGVDRADAAEQEVVLADLLEPLLGDAPAAGHVRQERDHVVRAFGAAEGEQQQGVVGSGIAQIGHDNDPATRLGRPSHRHRLPGPPRCRTDRRDRKLYRLRSCITGVCDHAVPEPSLPSPYRAIFAVPGTKGFSAAGFLGRMPLSMMGIGVVTMISQLTGRYGLVSALSATLAMSAAVIGPLISRLVDRHGQRRVLRPATLVALTAVAGLLICAQQRLADWTLFVFAAGASTACPAWAR